ncbi:MAG: helix-turn-helix transcriptional regulator, partial [Saprospiraceae bacterium]|nr:helix-turn-helix transcriptional regulator [Saprospiraceae bacterium]
PADHPDRPQHTPSLSRRELQILNLITQEMTNTEIAEHLFISINTVDSHRRNIMSKLGVRNTAGMVRVAMERGLLDHTD